MPHTLSSLQTLCFALASENPGTIMSAALHLRLCLDLNFYLSDSSPLTPRSPKTNHPPHFTPPLPLTSQMSFPLYSLGFFVCVTNIFSQSKWVNCISSKWCWTRYEASRINFFWRQTSNKFRETLEKLRHTDVLIWMLTGDKFGTLSNIAVPSHLAGRWPELYKITGLKAVMMIVKSLRVSADKRGPT